MAVVFCGGVLNPEPGSHAVAAPPEELAADQEELARKFQRLQGLASKIAESAERDDPARAEQLRSAIEKSNDLALPERFQAIVELLEEERLAAASRDQKELSTQLRVLLDLLLADPNEARLEAERRRLKAMLKRITQQIRRQQELRGESLGEAGSGELAERQAQLAEDVGELQKEMNQGEGAEPGAEGKPVQGADENPTGDSGDSQGNPADVPGNPAPSNQDPSGQSPSEDSPLDNAGQRLQAAKKSMEQAIEQLEKEQREEAQRRQAAAQKNLEDAREEIEQALRQLREEEHQRMLTLLATRLRRMLAEQSDILELTKQTEDDRPNRGRRATMVAASGLAGRERELVNMADGALRLLREDGASVAFPEMLGQIREDMQNVASRLLKAKLGVVTQGLEQEVVSSLEEAIASLDKTLKDLQQRQQNGQQGEPGGEPGEPPLVDRLAELRMIRTLQARILRRTKLWNDLRQTGEVTQADADIELSRLGKRQRRLMQAVRNLASPGN